MPKYRVLAKFGKKRREWFDVYTAKNAEDAIKQAKKHDRAISRGSSLPRGTSWKAVRVKPKRKQSILDLLW